MNNEMFLLIKKHPYTLIEQTKTKPQETLESKLKADSTGQARSAKKLMQTISFNHPINACEDERRVSRSNKFSGYQICFNITN